MKWIKDGLSMDETKVSAIIIAFFITLSFALWQVTNGGDISDNLLMLLAYELGAFTGIKVAETFTPTGKEKRSAKKSVKYEAVEEEEDSINLP